MRKPRDFDSELKAIGERAKLLQEKKLRQLGELAVATGADTLPIETLAGALLAAPEAEPTVKEAWRKRGVAFFQRSRRSAAGAPTQIADRAQASGRGRPPIGGAARACRYAREGCEAARTHSAVS